MYYYYKKGAKNLKKYLLGEKSVIALIILLVAAVIIPSISGIGYSETSDSEIFVPVIQDRGFNASITRPQRALYLNDMKVWPPSGTFKLIQRGIVFGDITIEINAFDDTYGIDYVEIFIDTTRVETDNETPYTYFWTEWSPGIHIIEARAFNNDGAFVDAASFQIFKFG